jgi:hypothetical protein
MRQRNLATSTTRINLVGDNQPNPDNSSSVDILRRL